MPVSQLWHHVMYLRTSSDTHKARITDEGRERKDRYNFLVINLVNSHRPALSYFGFEHAFLGPDKWADDFPVANGPRQSPIDIVPKEALYDSSLKPLKLKYDPSNSTSILNNGHSFQVDFVDDTDSSSKQSSATRTNIFHRSFSATEQPLHQNLLEKQN